MIGEDYVLYNKKNNSNFLMHHGIKGQRWGVRRFQNEDGTLTEEGKRHYGVSDKIDKKVRSLPKQQKKWMKDSNDKENVIFWLSQDMNIDIDKSDLDTIQEKANKISDLYAAAYQSAQKEANQAMKTEAFKKDLAKRIFNEANEYGITMDKEWFDDLRYDHFYQMIMDEKYTPKTAKYLVEAEDLSDEYHNDIKNLAEKMTSNYSDLPVSKLGRDDISYKDVAKGIIREHASDSLVSYLNRHEDETYNNNDGIDESRSLSYKEYKDIVSYNNFSKKR